MSQERLYAEGNAEWRLRHWQNCRNGMEDNVAGATVTCLIK